MNHPIGKLVFSLCLFAALRVCAQVPVEIVLDPRHPGREIPADYLGLSFEMQRVLPDTNGLHFFRPGNRTLVNLFKTLDVKSLRVGGNTADRPTVPVPAVADVDALFTFARAAGVKVIYTLRLNHGDPVAAAQRAAYITRYYSRQLDCFAIGNEPNVFSTNYDVYLAEWKRHAAIITSRVPAAKFCGPGVSPGHEKWSAQFARDLAATGRLKYVSQHDYAGGDARKVTQPAIARDRILAPVMIDHYEKFAANFVPAVTAGGLSWRFEEANSFYDGGALDVSDTFASALWALNYQWWWAEQGMSGINFHTGDKVAARDENKPCRYATFWTATNGYQVHPIAYAEKMFSLGSRGRLIPVQCPPANSDLAAYAVRGGTGDYYVTVINLSHGDLGVDYVVKLGAQTIPGWRSGSLVRLITPDGDVARKTGVRLGGAEILDNARWSGKWEKLFERSKVRPVAVQFNLPFASAAVVRLEPQQPNRD